MESPQVAPEEGASALDVGDARAGEAYVGSGAAPLEGDRVLHDGRVGIERVPVNATNEPGQLERIALREHLDRAAEERTSDLSVTEVEHARVTSEGEAERLPELLQVSLDREVNVRVHDAVGEERRSEPAGDQPEEDVAVGVVVDEA